LKSEEGGKRGKRKSKSSGRFSLQEDDRLFGVFETVGLCSCFSRSLCSFFDSGEGSQSFLYYGSLFFFFTFASKCHWKRKQRTKNKEQRTNKDCKQRTKNKQKKTILGCNELCNRGSKKAGEKEERNHFLLLLLSFTFFFFFFFFFFLFFFFFFFFLFLFFVFVFSFSFFFF